MPARAPLFRRRHGDRDAQPPHRGRRGEPLTPPRCGSRRSRGGAAGASAAALVIAAYVQLVAVRRLAHLDAAIDPVTFRWLVAFHVAGAFVVMALAGGLAWLHAARAVGGPTLVVGDRGLRGLPQIALGVGGVGRVMGPAGGPAARVVAAFRSHPAPGAHGDAPVVTGHVLLGMADPRSVGSRSGSWAADCRRSPGRLTSAGRSERAFA